VTPRFPSDVGHGAMRARLESPRVCYATPGVRIGTTRASRQRQLPTKRCHAARLFGATRAYQPDSSSQPLHRQPRASVLGNCSTFTPARREPQHRLRDPARHSKPLDSWSFHISRPELWAVCSLQRDEEQAGERVGHATFSSALSNWTDAAHGIPSRTWNRKLNTPVPWWSITSDAWRRDREPRH
jgi:hypothetical protein